MAFDNRLIFHTVGDWPEHRVITEAVADTRRQMPEVERIIHETWTRTLADPGTKTLFDGSICRLERWNATPEQLRLSLSLTSYKIFVGTHLSGPTISERFGHSVMANPLGVSCALQTADGWLLLGRRNKSVAYYPNRIHPFAGSMDPRENPSPNVFDEIRRELSEEIGLQAEHLTDIRCVGLVEDVTLHHPELIFAVRTDCTRSTIETSLDASEHDQVEAIHMRRESIENALLDPDFTPVALASLLLWGRLQYGNDWFEGQL